jgi:hypothetical protein
MDTSRYIRKMARDIVMAHVNHVKNSVKAGCDDYIDLGVDEDFKVYESLCRQVIGRVLGVAYRDGYLFPNSVMLESISVIETEIKVKGYGSLLEKRYISEAVNEVCLKVLDSVKHEEFGHLYELETN